jgi:dCMP deaminase
MGEISGHKWNHRFLEIAHLIASWSKDPSTKVGAVAVSQSRQILSEGYNGLARRVRDVDERMERPAKYLWTVHAEANLVAHAANHGISLSGATVYTTHYPCAQCAALLINAGIIKVIVDASGKTNMGDETFQVAEHQFVEAGVFAISLTHTRGNQS